MTKEVAIISGGDKKNVSEMIRKMNEPFIITCDRGGIYALDEGLPIDLAVGDFDSISASELELLKDNAEEVVSVSSIKDDTDTELALALAFEKFPEADVTVFGAFGGRMDHLMANLFTVASPRLKKYAEQITMRDSQNEIHFYLPGTHTIQKNTEMKYLAFSLLTPVENFEIKQAKYNLDKVSKDYPITYASNEFLDTDVVISFDSGIVAEIQSHDL